MKSIVVLLVLALAVFASAEGVEQTAVEVQSQAAVEQAGAEAALQVQAAAMDMEEGEDTEETEDEDEEEDESDEADEDEDEAEDEEEEADEDEEEGEDEAEDEEEEEEVDEADDEAVSFLEAAAETEADATAQAQASTEVEVDEEGAPKKQKIAPKIGALVPPPPRPFKFHPERVVEAQTLNKFEDPEMGKLNLALAAVKEDILATNKQITDERKWVIAVAKIIASYNDKMKRVEAHIIALRKEMKQLYKKKKQIENLKLQKALESKLKEARDELATLTSSLKHVAVKQGELNRSGADLRATIAGIQAQLAKLRGQQLTKPRPRPAAKGKKCAKGMRYSRKAKKCVPRKAKGKVLRKVLGKKL